MDDNKKDFLVIINQKLKKGKVENGITRPLPYRELHDFLITEHNLTYGQAWDEIMAASKLNNPFSI